MDPHTRVTQLFNDSIAAKQAALQALVPAIVAAGRIMADALGQTARS